MQQHKCHFLADSMRSTTKNVLQADLHEIVEIFNLCAGVREVPQGPEAVLYEPLAGVAQVHGQCLHAYQKQTNVKGFRKKFLQKNSAPKATSVSNPDPHCGRSGSGFRRQK